MNPDFTLIWPLSCPKDGTTLGPFVTTMQPLTQPLTPVALLCCGVRILQTIRLLLFLTACLVVASPSFAQQFGYGGLLGSSLGTLTSSDDFAEPRSKGGFVAGGFVDVALTDLFSVQPQLLFVQKGAKIREAGVEGTVTLDYVEVPILGVVSFPQQGPIIPLSTQAPRSVSRSMRRSSSTASRRTFLTTRSSRMT